MNARDHFLSEQHQNVLLQFLTRKPLQSVIDTDDRQLITSCTTISDQTSYTNPQQLDETMELLVGGIQALSDDTQRLSSESLRYQNTLEFFSEEYSKLKVAVQETNSLLDAHKANQQMLEQNLASFQQQIDDLKNTSYDGTLIWKITNVQQKIGKLKIGFSY
jgi:chromosome segregation ATPase